MEFSMQTANYNRMINFMAQLESVATTDKEREVINSARGMFAKCAGTAQFEAGTAATMDANISNGTAPSFTGGMREHGGSNIKPMTQEEVNSFNADVDARNKQWKRQLSGLRRRVKTAEHTLEEYAEIAPGELDAWVDNVLRPTIEEYLGSEEGGLVWADESKKKVKKERGAGGFITPEMKRAKYDDDKKKAIEGFKKSQEDTKKKADDAIKASLDKADEADAKAKESDSKEGEEKKKKGGLFNTLKGLGKKALKAIDLASVSDPELRTCFESVFGNSEHLSDDAIRAICYNALDRKCR